MSDMILRVKKVNSCRECYNSDNNIGIHCRYKFHGKAKTQRHEDCPLTDTSDYKEALDTASAWIGVPYIVAQSLTKLKELIGDESNE